MSTRDGKNIANILFHVWGVGGGGGGGGGKKMPRGDRENYQDFLKLGGRGT